MLILLYHRIGAADADPWALSVTPEHFDEHMALLRRDFNLVSLAETMSGDLDSDRASVAVTFDDGYADVLHVAAPILARHEVPATVFVITGALDRPTVMWWDELTHLILGPGELPRRLELLVDGQPFAWDLGDAAQLTSDDCARARGWCAWQPAPTARHALYAALWERCQQAERPAIERVVAEVRAWAGDPPGSDVAYRLMTRDEVRTLASMPGMEIGSHSVTHPRLSALSSAAQREEIESSTREVERVTARRVASFAYPFGKPRDYSSETTRIVGDAGLLRACTNVRGLAVADTDPYELPRLFVYDCDGADFGSLLASQLALVQAP